MTYQNDGALENCPICGRVSRMKSDLGGLIHIYCKGHWWSKRYHHHVAALGHFSAVRKWNEDCDKIRTAITKFKSGTY